MTTAPTSPAAGAPDGAEALLGFVRRHPRLLVLTGAGVSTASGIPAYRDAGGRWRGRPPVQYRELLRDPAARRRYWARSYLGWPRVAAARPNAAHAALAAWQAAGHVHRLVTQNVDGLHQRAGSTGVVDLHGRLDRVVCLGCGALEGRAELQETLAALNPGAMAPQAPAPAPDGDAALAESQVQGFRVPDCPRCGGLLKPDVVFFGESVPRARVEGVYRALAESDALLVVGSSLMVYSGYRFARAAAQAGKPMALVNAGATRADGLWSLALREPCGPLLTAVAGALGP
jgi:NAD-dependent SIR2 family protein deacetylase